VLRVPVTNFDYIAGTLRPLWRGKLHALAVVASPVAWGYLLSISKTFVTVIGSTVYAIGILLCFGMSSVYHILCKTKKTQNIFRRLDHSFIYFLIAGTYTPLCLTVLSGSQRWAALGLLWAVSLTGVYLKMRAKAVKLATTFYLVLGWSSLLMLPSLYNAAGILPILLLFLGGVAYTLGAILFRKRVPVLSREVFSYHEVWHAMTILAAAFHYGAVYMVLTSAV